MQDALLEVRDELQEKDTTDAAQIIDPFKESSWGESLNEDVVDDTTIHEQEKETAIKEEKVEEEIVDANEYLKRELGYESWELAKTEVEELRKIRDGNKQKEIEYANDDSRNLAEYLREGNEDEVFNLLDKKRQVDKLLKADVNEDTAADIVKLAMRHKYQDFTPDEIEHRFKKQFALPKEPVQLLTEDDDDFLVRQSEWKEQVSDIKKDLVIEAKLAKPELEKMKVNLVLPNISNGTESQLQTQAQKELEQAEIIKRRDQYLSSLSSDSNLFTGFETSYKNEGVDIPVSYVPTDEEKKALSKELETFDVDGFILSRWFNEDGSPNVKGLMSDVYLLRNKDKIHQKIASETGTKVIDNYIRNAKNVNVTGGNQSSFSLNQPQAEKDKATENFFASER